MARLLTQVKDSNTLHKVNDSSVVSPWRIDLPLEEYNHNSVVVYFYSEVWIPISCFSLAEAVALYQKALILGKEILVYPPDLCPYTQTTLDKFETEFGTLS